MSSDAATPATPAADGRVPEPRSGAAPVAVPRPTTAEPADGAGRDPTDAASRPATREPADASSRRRSTAGPADEAGEEPSRNEPTGHERTGEAGTDTRPDTGPDPRPDTGPDEAAGGRLTARVREARARLQPERPLVPAPRSPEGVVPPPDLGPREGAPAPDLVRSLDDLHTSLAQLEEAPGTRERCALVRAIELSASGVPDAGWSTKERIDNHALTGAAELAGTLHASATALLERLDAEERAAPAVEIGAVVTALQVARMVLDLESFARHGR